MRTVPYSYDDLDALLAKAIEMFRCIRLGNCSVALNVERDAVVGSKSHILCIREAILARCTFIINHQVSLLLQMMWK